MKLRLIKQKDNLKLLCLNGSVIDVDDTVLIRLLTSFKSASSFKGTEEYWNRTIASMEDVIGTTLAYVDQKNTLVILDESLFENLLNRTDCVSASEYAELHGKSRATIKKICADGRIPGAYKTSSGWLIPKNAPYPKDERFGNTKRSSKSKESKV